MKKNRIAQSLAWTLVTVGAAAAQTSAPDAGRILQEVTPAAPALPHGGKVPQLPVPPVPQEVEPGGAEVAINGLRFSGNTVFDAETLLGLVGSLKGASFDLAGLEKLVEKITSHYRAAGYPFATAYLPEQDLQDGVLRIDIIEGRYGRVQVKGDDPAAVSQAEQYLLPLQPEQLIRQALLERTTLLLGDLPGVVIEPVLSPGADHGHGDLMVELKREQSYNVEAGVDNHGGFYSGMTRARLALNVNSPLMLGDQFTAQVLRTNMDLWMGHANYSAPLGASGWRGNVGYTNTRYTLGRDFVGSEGTAKVGSLGVSYALLRSLRSNVMLSATLQEKALFNSYQNGEATERYRSKLLPLAVQFNRLDEWGSTTGALTWSVGFLSKDDDVTRGNFRKVNLDLNRIQSLTSGFSFYGRFSQQIASKNLDSSERMSLGGVTGVRAYGTGEGYGDEGWLTQLELRYTQDAVTTYAFYDYGHIRINAKPELMDTVSPDVKRAGAGFGLRFQHTHWMLDTALAWRPQGDAPTSEGTRDPKPRAWVNLTYKF